MSTPLACGASSSSRLSMFTTTCCTLGFADSATLRRVTTTTFLHSGLCTSRCRMCPPTLPVAPSNIAVYSTLASAADSKCMAEVSTRGRAPTLKSSQRTAASHTGAHFIDSPRNARGHGVDSNGVRQARKPSLIKQRDRPPSRRERSANSYAGLMLKGPRVRKSNPLDLEVSQKPTQVDSLTAEA